LVFTEELSLDQAKKGVLAGGLRQICYKIWVFGSSKCLNSNRVSFWIKLPLPSQPIHLLLKQSLCPRTWIVINKNTIKFANNLMKMNYKWYLFELNAR
jgi:hypothetical protein